MARHRQNEKENKKIHPNNLNNIIEKTFLTKIFAKNYKKRNKIVLQLKKL